MILGFRVCNYRSFRDEATMSLTATRLDQGVGHPIIVADDGTTRDVLPVLAVLGANASGKSNVLRAIGFMRSFVLNSARSSPFDRVPRDPFRFDGKPDRPSLFEIEFALDGERFMYGFELGEDRINGEWLFTYPHKRPQTIFEREGDDFQFGKRLVGGSARAVAEIVRPNSLFLSTMATAKSRELAKIYYFFGRRIAILAADEEFPRPKRDPATEAAPYPGPSAGHNGRPRHQRGANREAREGTRGVGCVARCHSAFASNGLGAGGEGCTSSGHA